MIALVVTHVLYRIQRYAVEDLWFTGSQFPGKRLPVQVA